MKDVPPRLQMDILKVVANAMTEYAIAQGLSSKIEEIAYKNVELIVEMLKDERYYNTTS